MAGRTAHPPERRARQPGSWLRTAGRHPFPILVGSAVLALACAGAVVGWSDLWSTPDQRGRWLLEREHYTEAAQSFADPMWRGVALMRAGTFKEAAQQFGGMDSAEAAYDQGNALVMLGKYDDAVSRYDRALALRPGWAEAEANRALARTRAERMRTTGGDQGDTEDDPDDVVYDKNRKDGGKDTETAGGAPMSDEAIRSLWLKRVQTRPADFLRARFAYQLQVPPEGGP